MNCLNSALLHLHVLLLFIVSLILLINVINARGTDSFVSSLNALYTISLCTKSNAKHVILPMWEGAKDHRIHATQNISLVKIQTTKAQ